VKRWCVVIALVAAAACGRSSTSEENEGPPMADTGITQLQKTDIKVGDGAEAR
jgi:hypothetical protein